MLLLLLQSCIVICCLSSLRADSYAVSLPQAMGALLLPLRAVAKSPLTLCGAPALAKGVHAGLLLLLLRLLLWMLLLWLTERGPLLRSGAPQSRLLLLLLWLS